MSKTCVLAKSIDGNILFFTGKNVKAKQIAIFLLENEEELCSDDADRFWMEHMIKYDWKIYQDTISRKRIKYVYDGIVVDDPNSGYNYQVINKRIPYIK